MAKKLRNTLDQKYLIDYGECALFFLQNHFYDTHKFLDGLASYLFTINRCYETLKRSKNPLGCIHFVRMAADVCCYAYGLLMAIDEKHRKQYLKHLLAGKELRQLDTGLRYKDENGVEKKQKYTTTFLAEQISQHLYEDFAAIYTLSNQYIHPSSFYQQDLDWYKNLDKKREINYLNDVDKWAVEMDQEVAKKFYQLMHELNELFFRIVRYIMGDYERAYLWERMQQFPLQITNIEIGVQPKGKGKMERIFTFSTNLQLVWDMLTQYEKAPNEMLDQIRHIITSGSISPSEIIQLNITNEILKNASKYKAQIEEYIAQKVDLEKAGIEHKVTQAQMGKGNLLYLDWLFPDKKVRKELTPNTGTTNEGLQRFLVPTYSKKYFSEKNQKKNTHILVGNLFLLGSLKPLILSELRE